MKIVILTGGIGCGKTTVLEAFRDMGVPCFVADEVARGYFSDPLFVKRIETLFGSRAICGDGSVDRRHIAQVAFGDKAMLQRLNDLVHPRVWQDFLDFANKYGEAPYVLFESAIAYEYGFDSKADKVICVYVDREERFRRLMERDKASREELQARMDNQMDAEEKMMRADYVVLNYEGNPRRRQVEYIDRLLKQTDTEE